MDLPLARGTCALAAFSRLRTGSRNHRAGPLGTAETVHGHALPKRSNSTGPGRGLLPGGCQSGITAVAVAVAAAAALAKMKPEIGRSRQMHGSFGVVDATGGARANMWAGKAAGLGQEAEQGVTTQRGTLGIFGPLQGTVLVSLFVAGVHSPLHTIACGPWRR